MNKIRNNCAICNGKLENIFVLEKMPVTLSCLEEIEDFEYQNLSFSVCVDCNTIQLDNLIDLEVLYSKSHNYISIGETWKGYFEMFNNNISQLIEDKKVLEIGCPSGKIALLNNNYKKWFIVEPNKNKDIFFNEKIVFIEEFFDDNFKSNENIDLIVHSHLFEHIYEPNKFLKKCYEILDDDGKMFFGVPNMQYITENNLCLFLGVFFEHTIFLNKENICYLLNKNGFQIIDIIEYKNHSTLYNVKKVKNTQHIPIKTITNYYENFMSTLKEFLLYVEYCNNIIKTSNKRVYIFGASYNTQLLLTLGLCSNITGILDNCKYKQGKYIYGYELKIYDPEIVRNNDCIVILKNGYYFKEVRKQLECINNNTQIL
jgi:SAM-dependent methyltransferase